MRIIVNGQQGFGKACLKAMLERGDDIAAACGQLAGQVQDRIRVRFGAKTFRSVHL